MQSYKRGNREMEVQTICFATAFATVFMHIKLYFNLAPAGETITSILYLK